MKTPALSLIAAGLLLSTSAHAAPTFVNGLTISGASLDVSSGTITDRRVGFFSDIYYDPNRSEWWGLSDRGPGGGLLNYDTRVQRFTLDVDAATGAISNFQIAQTIKFSNGGSTMNGIAPNPGSVLGNALDPEGFVINPNNGNFLVSDEYGPSLYEFNRSGTLVRTFNTPAGLVPRNAVSGTANYAADTGNTAGKRTNRGFEGLAVSPDGKFTFAMLQSATLDEGGGNGTINRIVKFDNITGNAVAQYGYQMKRASQGQGISSLVAINNHEFMVLERNNLGLGAGAAISSGGGANTADKEVYKIDLTGASDITGIDVDAAGAVFAKVTKSAKFIDLDATTIDLDGNGSVESAGKSPEKWEGLAIGPRLADGSFLVLAGNDNDYSVTQSGSGQQFDVYFRFSDTDPYASSIQCAIGTTTACFLTSNNATAATLSSDYQLLPGVLHAYKVSATDLAGYTAPVPEPETYALLLAGLWLVGAAARRRKN
jgi:hypothetical protein